jgi:hypothetical protein
MTSPIQKAAGRIAVAVLLILLAAGTVFATAATQPAAPAPAFAEPSAAASPGAKASPDGDEAKEEDADESPDADTDEDADASPSPANLARIVDALAAAGITTTADQLAELAKKVGVGGAVRVLRFADASGKTPAEILALREAGKGWGVIARELKIDVNPGNGSVMGKGHGQDKAAKAAAKAARAAERAERKAGSGD